MKAFLAISMALAFVGAKAQIPEDGDVKQGQPPAFIVPEFEGPSDGYYQGYLLLKGAEQFKNPDELNERLRNALATFREVSKRFPNWKKELVAARIKDVEARLKKVRLPDDEPQEDAEAVP